MKIQLHLSRLPVSRISIAAAGALALAVFIPLAGCHSNSGEPAEHMTSYSHDSTAGPQLFTIPQDQMEHVQVVTIEPSALKHTLRLTGAVEYNAFNTTPVITQVGRAGQQDSGGARRSCEGWPGDA